MGEYTNKTTGRRIRIPDDDIEAHEVISNDPEWENSVPVKLIPPSSLDQQPTDMPSTPEPEQKQTGAFKGLGLGALQGASYGFADEIEGGFNKAKSEIKNLYSDEKDERSVGEHIDEAREKYKLAEKEQPGLYMVGDIGSAIIPTPVGVAGMAGKIIKGGTKAKKLADTKKALDTVNKLKKASVLKEAGKAAAKGTVHGGVEGAIQGFGRAEGDILARAKGAGEGAAIGAGTGALLVGGVPIVKEGLKRAQAIPAKTTAFINKLGQKPRQKQLIDEFADVGREGQANRALIEIAENDPRTNLTEARRQTKDKIGLSPSEQRETAAKTLRDTEIKAQTDVLEDVKTNEAKVRETQKQKTDYIKQHTGQLDESLKNELTRETTDAITNINQDLDLVMDSADTSMKGALANRKFTDWVTKKKPQDAEAIQNTIAQTTNDMFGRADEILSGIMKDAGKGISYTPSAGSKAKRLKQGLETLKGWFSSSFQKARNEGISPDFMSDAFISLDMLKRRLGNMIDRTKTDKIATDPAKELYDELKNFLEDTDIFDEMAKSQSRINRKWEKLLDIKQAAEQALMTQGRRKIDKAADPFKRTSRGEASKIGRTLENIDTPSADLDIELMDKFGEASSELSDVLVAEYNNIPELQQAVGRIKQNRAKIVDNLDKAYQDALDKKSIGLTDKDKATRAMSKAEKRGVQAPNIKEMKTLRRRELQLANEVDDLERAKELNRRALEEMKVKEVDTAPKSWKESQQRMNENLDFQNKLDNEIENMGAQYKPLAKFDEMGREQAKRPPNIVRQVGEVLVPDPVVATRRQRAVEKGIDVLGEKVEKLAPKAGARIEWDLAKDMWGDRPTENDEIIDSVQGYQDVLNNPKSKKKKK